MDQHLEQPELKWKSAWRRWNMLAGPIVFVVVAYAVLQWTMSAIIHHRPERVVPDLKNHSVLEALEILSQVDMSLKKDGEQFSSATPAGTILEQNPASGTTVREGKTIRVIVSQGGEKVQVPSLEGLDLRKAEIELRQKNLALGELSEIYSVRFPQNHVVSQDPAQGTMTDRTSLVSLVVSKGPPPEGTVLVPDFTSKSVKDAKRWADAHRVEIASVQKETSLQGTPGTILRQSPRPDSVLTKGTRLTLVVVGEP